MKEPYRDWKSQLEILFHDESSHYQLRWYYCLMCKWKGYPVIRKSIDSFFNGSKKKFEIYTKKNKKKFETELRQWFNEFILNYDDLTTQQKLRIRDKQFVGENKEKDCRGNRIITDPTILKYAKIKRLRVRFVLPNDKKKYRLVTKAVICELL